ncbi:13429_t:CDS:1, partial [Gigaspora rosea]
NSKYYARLGYLGDNIKHLNKEGYRTTHNLQTLFFIAMINNSQRNNEFDLDYLQVLN